MAKTASFTKRSLITKANSRIVFTAGLAAFVVIFTMVAAKTLVSQASYQNKVISTKKNALATLQSDLNARDSLVSSYKTFVGTPQNVLGGNPTGSGDQDGDNAKIILDSLPSKYDFPALATSLEKLIVSQGLTITSISGTDEEATQASAKPSGAPAPIPMPFQVQVSGPYQGMKNLIDVFERSIRPIQVQKIEFSGDEGSMSVIINAQTFFQPEKNLNIKSEVVK
jgi:hypothetical protein